MIGKKNLILGYSVIFGSLVVASVTTVCVAHNINKNKNDNSSINDNEQASSVVYQEDDK